VTFGSCKEASRAGHRGHVGLCGLGAISENNNPHALCTGFCPVSTTCAFIDAGSLFTNSPRFVGQFSFHQLTSSKRACDICTHAAQLEGHVRPTSHILHYAKESHVYHWDSEVTSGDFTLWASGCLGPRNQDVWCGCPQSTWRQWLGTCCKEGIGMQSVVQAGLNCSTLLPLLFFQLFHTHTHTHTHTLPGDLSRVECWWCHWAVVKQAIPYESAESWAREEGMLRRSLSCTTRFRFSCQKGPCVNV